jgi:hypothetical protein
MLSWAKCQKAGQFFGGPNLLLYDEHMHPPMHLEKEKEREKRKDVTGTIKCSLSSLSTLKICIGKTTV